MKGNMFLGYARGSVGDVTFSRVKNQQVARARNRKPNNPRTSAQMTQRSRFMGAVKFFSRGVQNLFQFAFEDKRPQESDYNAFMRVNADKGMYLTKSDFDNPRYPALGNWTMTKGSLQPFRCSIDSSSKRLSALTSVQGESSKTYTSVGDLSKALVAGGDFLEGDIITLVNIVTAASLGNESNPVIVSAIQPFWRINQFIIKQADTTLLASINFAASTDTPSGYIKLQSTLALQDIGAAVMIHSRKTDSKVYVSSQELINTSDTEAAIELGTSQEWLDKVLQTWSASEAAVLEGSRASNK